MQKTGNWSKAGKKKPKVGFVNQNRWLEQVGEGGGASVAGGRVNDVLGSACPLVSSGHTMWPRACLDAILSTV